MEGEKVKEPEEDYEVEKHKNWLSKEQLEEPDRRLKVYESGTEKAIPWEEAKRGIEKKYGF
ncbi:addiction module protein [Salegentibacter sp. LM13S]|nr:addiction module protein [Salegentibacter lacus]